MKRNIFLVMNLVLFWGLIASGCLGPDTPVTDPSTHSHQYTVSVTAEASCKEEGLRTYFCAGCGHSYTESIPTTGHHQYISSVSREPTCSVDGLRTFTCTVCNDHYTQGIPATGNHHYSAAVTIPATCATEGEITFSCIDCDSSYTEVLSPTGEHNFTETVLTPATCSSNGEKRFTCSGCGDSYTQLIPATGAHSYVSTMLQAADCVTAGMTEFLCSICGSSHIQTIPAMGHHYEPSGDRIDPTCTDEGSQIMICSNCEDRFTEVLPALGHDWLDATCTEPSICARCSEIHGEPLGHELADPESTEEQICSRCEETVQLTISWYESGTYLVGTDLPSGEYFIQALTPSGLCQYAVYNSQDGSELEYAHFYSHYFLALEEGQILQLHAGRLAKASQIRMEPDNNSISHGMYRVGQDLPAGEYTLTTTKDGLGYFCVYDSASCSKVIKQNHHFEDSTVIQVEEGQYLYLSRSTAIYMPPIPKDPWIFSDAVELNEYATYAFDAINSAMTYIEDSKIPANSAYTAIFYNQALIHIRQTRITLEAMGDLLETRESLPLENSQYETLQELVDYAVELCQQADGPEITFQNYAEHERLPEIAEELHATCVAIRERTIILLESFS